MGIVIFNVDQRLEDDVDPAAIPPWISVFEAQQLKAEKWDR